jgi:glycosyltransferase involved in cell wall biosynthesis
MPRVTIGVPVYNAESLLEQCLENLAAQTFRDFKVIVLDNASTDGTPAIAERFAARDSRFSLRRQPHNKGALGNFVDALAAADTPYFMWRADDDVSDVNFVGEMVRLLDAHPKAALAVGLTVLDKRGRKRRKPFPIRLAGEPDASYRVRLLTASRAQWMFGLFRTNDVRESLHRVLGAYKHLNAFDHLVLFPFIVSLRVVGTNATSFITGFVERALNAKARPLLPPERMRQERADFLRYCRAELQRLGIGGLAHAILPAYARRSHRWTEIFRSQLRIMRGELPAGATKKYD